MGQKWASVRRIQHRDKGHEDTLHSNAKQRAGRIMCPVCLIPGVHGTEVADQQGQSQGGADHCGGADARVNGVCAPVRVTHTHTHCLSLSPSVARMTQPHIAYWRLALSASTLGAGFAWECLCADGMRGLVRFVLCVVYTGPHVLR